MRSATILVLAAVLSGGQSVAYESPPLGLSDLQTLADVRHYRQGMTWLFSGDD